MNLRIAQREFINCEPEDRPDYRMEMHRALEKMELVEMFLFGFQGLTAKGVPSQVAVRKVHELFQPEYDEEPHLLSNEERRQVLDDCAGTYREALNGI